MKNLPRKCHVSHKPKFLVTYDIGKDNTEEFLVCENCLDGSHDESFKQYILSKKSLESNSLTPSEIYFDFQEQRK